MACTEKSSREVAAQAYAHLTAAMFARAACAVSLCGPPTSAFASERFDGTTNPSIWLEAIELRPEKLLRDRAQTDRVCMPLGSRDLGLRVAKSGGDLRRKAPALCAQRRRDVRLDADRYSRAAGAVRIPIWFPEDLLQVVSLRIR